VLLTDPSVAALVIELRERRIPIRLRSRTRAKRQGFSVQLFSTDNPTPPPMHAAPRVREGDVRGHLPLWAVRLVVCFIAIVSAGFASPAFGQDIDREYKFKAVFLYKFATYT